LNIESAEGKLVTFILCGMPSLMEVLRKIPPLYQRIAVQVVLTPLTKESTIEYVKHRLRLAGGREDIFTPRAYELIYRYSMGYPRLINAICDNAMLEAAIEQKLPVDEKIVGRAIVELGLARRKSASQQG